MQKILLAVAVLVAVAYAIPKTSDCNTNDDCGDESCCVPMRRFYILSKRAVLAEKKVSSWEDRMKGGKCVKYIKESGSCHMLGFASCGCEPGTKCNYYPEELPVFKEAVLKEAVVGKRKMIYRPGKSLCEKE